MKRLGLLLSVLFFAFIATTNLRADDGKKSKMVLEFKSQKDAEKAVKAIKELKGIEDIKIAEEKNRVIVFYDKKELGCCSNIYKAIGKAQVEYTLISNEEYPKCDSKSHEKKGKSCCKHKSAKGSCEHHKGGEKHHH